MLTCALGGASATFKSWQKLLYILGTQMPIAEDTIVRATRWRDYCSITMMDPRTIKA